MVAREKEFMSLHCVVSISAINSSDIVNYYDLLNTSSGATGFGSKENCGFLVLPSGGPWS